MSTFHDRSGYDAALHLLDRQIIDRDGRMVAKVDDLELQQTDGGELVVTALRTGPAALGPRFGGHLGAWTVAAWARLRPEERPRAGRIALRHVTRIDSAIHLDGPKADFDGEGLEKWVEQRIIRPLPGSGHAPS